jgi:predicted transcriptional regulator
MSYLTRKGWISCREIKGENKGRPLKMYKLIVPVSEIISSIEREKEIEAANTLNLIKKFREYVS